MHVLSALGHSSQEYCYQQGAHMFGERRKHQRLLTNRVARIQTDVAATTTSQECTIIDISDRGARLFVNNSDIPDRFCLVIVSDKVTRQECRVVWRLGGEVGVEFVSLGSDQSRLNALERLREDARQIFQDTNRTT
jgi:hypothetical protein